jgi:dihydroorotate dehydrogenase (NAD+) catalytic subunit
VARGVRGAHPPGRQSHDGGNASRDRPVAVRCIWQVREALPDVPIIGMGGVRTGQDALELILAGATLVSVGTAIFHDPPACMRIVRELEEELARRGVERLADVVGLAHEPSAGPRRRLTGNVS